MKTLRKKNYVMFKNESESVTAFSSYLTKHHQDFKLENVVVDILNYNKLEGKDLLAFLELSNVHRSENKSFVLISDALHIDEIPDELIVVPSLQEAEDMVQMDEVQRDLGF